jgi:hypothetical protein
MENNTKSGDIDQVEAIRRAKMNANLEEAIRSLIRIHTESAEDGTVTVRWGALPEDDPASYSRYREAWAKVADALRRGDFKEPTQTKKAAAE